MADRSMLDLAQAVRAQIIKETAPKIAAKRSFTIKGLERLALWGATATGALLLAVLSSRSEVGSQRMAAALSGGQTQAASTHAFNAEAETRRLADAVRGLAVDSDQVKSRLAAVEHDMDDVTGSVSRQIEVAKQAARAEDGPTVSATAAATTGMLTPSAMLPTAPAFPPSTTPPSADTAAPAAAVTTQYGIDIGSGLTIQALRMRWTAIRSAHPDLFEGLEPIVSIKEVAHASRVELRLVVGPFAQADAATQLCASVAVFGLFCQPTLYDGQRLALR
jgi:hypothetical protein